MTTPAASTADTQLRRSAEALHAHELDALAQEDTRARPAQWRLSPQAVVTYLMGGRTKSGVEISPKYIGNRRLIETAVATLATDRALLILGVPGTAKSWVSEHLAAAISGSSEMIVQCTAGTDENQIRYGWNYALLLAKGPSREAMVATPLMRAMEAGRIVRFEELTRMPSDVQDTLITVLSEKLMPIPEINDSIHATRGFNMIATANARDKGVNELSSALKRRFNVVVLPLPADLNEEVKIVTKRVGEIGGGLELPKIAPADQEIMRIVTVFRELRDGQTLDGRLKLKSPSGSLSTAEAIAVTIGAWAEAGHFGSGVVDAQSMAANLVGAIVKDPVQDKVVLQEYLETVVRERKPWADLYGAIREVM
ncbi:AAA domain-containing protein [Bradyrhizobium sp. 83012]|uniref:AAA domain-containing protein n=1 Tax=Bradyrhizobium aeschynomenes TaxID=2734909 RepID=A0ABX2CEC6_9BRAD|nr:AAA family ATPase [Bradyrhizobium aeschynomenes]NPU13236.1 AAA domain-containing protein [Bradyrhizobium aeschynomenes]NPU66563.1 AAA domain-containing protein [Bradyrhizobium aeschynomenes]